MKNLLFQFLFSFFSSSFSFLFFLFFFFYISITPSRYSFSSSRIHALFFLLSILLHFSTFPASNVFSSFFSFPFPCFQIFLVPLHFYTSSSPSIYFPLTCIFSPFLIFSPGLLRFLLSSSSSYSKKTPMNRL